VFLDHQPAPVAGMVAALEHSMGSFTGDTTQFDGIAVLAVKRLDMWA
jgi:hypothetical protein